MNLNNYQELAIRTAKQVDQQFDLMHAAFGLTGEAGEFVDAVKKHIVYGKSLDKANIFEELGDVLWYVALACETLGVDMAEIAQQNISKLKLRYPEKYSNELANQRLDKKAIHDQCSKSLTAEQILGVEPNIINHS